jgi:phosphoglycolate phosphatase
MNTAAVIFDWDGTLYNSSYLLDEAILAAHRNLKLALPAAVSLCLFDSSIDGANKLRRALEVLPKQMQRKLQREIAADFIRRERAAELFPDIENLLRRLRAQGSLLCIATGRERGRLSSDLAKFCLDDVFEATVCAGEACAKPDPEMLLQLMHRLALPTDRMLFVGDSLHDEQAAHAAGMPFIRVAMSQRDRERTIFEATAPSAACAASLALLIDRWRQSLAHIPKPVAGLSSQQPN